MLARSGCPPQRAEGLEERVERAISALLDLAAPVGRARLSDVERIDEDAVRTAGSVLRGSGLGRRLQGAVRLSVHLATLGPAPERVVSELAGSGEELDAFLLDSAASVMVENLARETRRALAAGVAGLVPGVSIAPGYGDLDLSAQATIIDLLGGDGTGVSLLPGSFMMEPVKSTTGVTAWLPRTG